MKYIHLTKGQNAMVDDQDYEYINQWKWLCSSHGYAVRVEYLGGGRKNTKRQTIKMHRLIMDTPIDMETDHINGDRLDNRKENLRIVTRTENQHNRKLNSNNTSGYKGVHLYKPTNRWVARITVNSRLLLLGYFEEIKEAALAYNEAAKKYHGKYAKLNLL